MDSAKPLHSYGQKYRFNPEVSSLVPAANQVINKFPKSVTPKDKSLDELNSHLRPKKKSVKYFNPLEQRDLSDSTFKVAAVLVQSPFWC